MLHHWLASHEGFKTLMAIGFCQKHSLNPEKYQKFHN
jgi:hypothetical protein